MEESGTVRELTQRSPEGTPIAVFPSGTANLLSKYLWRRRRVRAEMIAHAIEVGHACRFDAGLANGRLFILMCSCGFDAAVVRTLHERREGHIGYVSYLKPLFKRAGSTIIPSCCYTVRKMRKPM